MFGMSLRRSSWRDELQLTRCMRLRFNSGNVGDQLWMLSNTSLGNRVTKQPSWRALCVAQRVSDNAVIKNDGVILRMDGCSIERSSESISTRWKWGRDCNSRRNCESGGIYPLQDMVNVYIVSVTLSPAFDLNWALTVIEMAPRWMNLSYHSVLQHVDIYNHTVDVALLSHWMSSRHVHIEQESLASSWYPFPRQRIQWFYTMHQGGDTENPVLMVNLHACTSVNVM